MKHLIHLVASGLLLLTALALNGCRTDDQAHSGDMASVMIDGHTEAEIRQATAAVFLANGFEQGNNLVFDRKGAVAETVAYGGWSTDPVWIRMRISLYSLEKGSFVLAANVFKVKDRNRGVLEEEQRYTFQKRDECKNLLDQVKARLEAPPAN